MGIPLQRIGAAPDAVRGWWRGYRLMEALADAGADATAMVRVEARAADLPQVFLSRPRRSSEPPADSPASAAHRIQVR